MRSKLTETKILPHSTFIFQDLLSGEFTEAAKKLRAATKAERDLKQQLGKINSASKDLEEAYNLVVKAKEVALAKVFNSNKVCLQLACKAGWSCNHTGLYC